MKVEGNSCTAFAAILGSEQLLVAKEVPLSLGSLLRPLEQTFHNLETIWILYLMLKREAFRQE